MAKQVMLTTIDNPYDPFTEFESWNAYDVSKEYFTCAYLGRIVKTSPVLSQADNDLAIDDAMTEIIKENVLGIYKRVTQE